MDHPSWVLVCHCDECKKRTGSDYGVSVVTEPASTVEFSGETKTHTRTGDSGSEVHYEFCPECGTTVKWKIDMSNRVAFAGGAFDNITNLGIAGEMYTDYLAPWVKLGCELSLPQALDDGSRKALSEKAKLIR